MKKFFLVSLLLVMPACHSNHESESRPSARPDIIPIDPNNPGELPGSDESQASLEKRSDEYLLKATIWDLTLKQAPAETLIIDSFHGPKALEECEAAKKRKKTVFPLYCLRN